MYCDSNAYYILLLCHVQISISAVQYVDDIMLSCADDVVLIYGRVTVCCA